MGYAAGVSWDCALACHARRKFKVQYIGWPLGGWMCALMCVLMWVLVWVLMGAVTQRHLKAGFTSAVRCQGVSSGCVGRGASCA